MRLEVEKVEASEDEIQVSFSPSAEDALFPKKAVRKEVLEKAEDAVLRDRQSTYGDLEDSFSHTAALWSTHLGVEVTPTDVPILLALLKIARLKSSPEHLDNWVDIAGYAACGGEIATRGRD